ncbi:MAG: hypothetical protein SLAVMIC_00925 [uncultured marine phage]|uniref:Uncharacterized protein n=1 Tax=uncultured marine phage TaxID=707152 RepID=A0A8D9CF15_9VIRU|nr:MAG: hypothetical protein SLAVMIC_00925 [uncultured marine phage]
MIAKRYIEQGVKIREEYLDVSKKLEAILTDIKGVGLQLKKHTEDLKYISENLDGYDGEQAKLVILNKLTDVEIQGNKLTAIYKPVNEKLESLKKQEEILYNTIKEQYPDLSDEDMVKEFEPYIKKLN